MDADTKMKDKVIVTMEGKDEQFAMVDVDVTMDMTEPEILDKMDSIMKEMQGVSLQDEEAETTDWNFTVRKVAESGNVYIYPKPEAGK